MAELILKEELLKSDFKRRAFLDEEGRECGCECVRITPRIHNSHPARIQIQPYLILTVLVGLGY